MPAFAAVFFDLDGTLLNTTPLYEQADTAFFGELGMTLTREHFNDLYNTGWHLAAEWMIALGFGKEQHEELRQRRFRMFIEHLEHGVTYYADADYLLTALEGRPNTGIITTSHDVLIDVSHRHTGIRDRMTILATGDEVKKGKPDPEGLLLAAKKLGVEPKDCLYVGDLPSDIQAAKNAGMHSCLVWRAHTPQGADIHADYRLDSLEGLVKLL